MEDYVIDALEDDVQNLRDDLRDLTGLVGFLLNHKWLTFRGKDRDVCIIAKDVVPGDNGKLSVLSNHDERFDVSIDSITGVSSI